MEKDSTVLTTENLFRILIINKYLMKYSNENNVRSVQDILNYLKEKGIKTSRATLYRNLQQLKQLSGCENYHKRNKIPYEIGDDEFEVVDETGYYYTSETKYEALDFQINLPIPLTEEHFKAINNIKEFAQNNNNLNLETDCIILSEFLNSII